MKAEPANFWKSEAPSQAAQHIRSMFSTDI